LPVPLHRRREPIMVKRTLAAFTLCLVACGGGASNGTPPTTPSGADAKPASKGITPTAEAKAIADAPDRDDADKKLDGGRKPAELLTFIGVKPGWKVADLAAGGGYTTELLVRAV